MSGTASTHNRLAVDMDIHGYIHGWIGHIHGYRGYPWASWISIGYSIIGMLL